MSGECGCYACIGDRPAYEGSWLTVGMTRMILCDTCGNKRCPHSTDHRHECTGSNEPGQAGSRYPEPSTSPPPDVAAFLASLIAAQPGDGGDAAAGEA